MDIELAWIQLQRCSLYIQINKLKSLTSFYPEERPLLEKLIKKHEQDYEILESIQKKLEKGVSIVDLPKQS